MGAKTQVEQTTQSYDWADFGPARPSGADSDDGGIILSTLTSGGRTGLQGRHKALNLGQIFNRGMPNGIGIAVALNQTSTGVASTISGVSFRFRIDRYRGQNGHLDRVALISATVGMYRLSATAGQWEKPGAPRQLGTALNSARFADHMAEITQYNNGLTFIDAAANNGKANVWFDERGGNNLAVNLVSTLKSGVEMQVFITGM